MLDATTPAQENAAFRSLTLRSRAMYPSMEPCDKREKAKAGVWLLKQAILDTLREERRPMQPKEVADALGLRGLGYELLIDMPDRGEVVKGDGRHPPYSLPARPGTP
jgi:hypothetical protein